jgi:hypothetical protein
VKMYNPRTLCPRFVEHREQILERIQSMIDRGDATTVDGVKFRSDLGDEAIRQKLKPFTSVVHHRRDRRYKTCVASAVDLAAA